MTKTSKIKLIVSSVLALGATGAVGGTYAALTLTGANSKDSLEGGIGIDSVVIENKVVDVAVALNSSNNTLNVDGYQVASDNDIGLVDGNEANDLTFGLDITVTGDPSAWTFVTVTCAWAEEAGAATYLKAPAAAKINVSEFTAEEEDAGTEEEAAGTKTVNKITNYELSLTWADTYQGGFLKWLNTQYGSDPDVTWQQMQKFQTAINGSKLNVTVEATLTSGTLQD